MAEQQGPIYEYMMGTFDLNDATWMTGMNDMLNNFGLAGWKRSVVTLLDARHLLVMMERRFPSAAEYAATQPAKAESEFAAEPDAAKQAKYRAMMDAEMATAEVEADEYDAEGEALMAAKVAEVIPWARRQAPANGRRRKRGAQRKKAVAIAHKAGS